MRALRRWKAGLAVAVVAFTVGSIRLVAAGSTNWLTWVCFVIAAVYAFAALIGRRLIFPERPEDWLGRLERAPTIAGLLHRHHAQSMGPAAHPNTSVARQIRTIQQGSDDMVTRNRIANALATIAAIVGMVLVVTGAGTKGGGDNDDNAPSAPAPPSQTAPAVPGQGQPGVPAATNPAPQQQTQAPAPTKKDNDGDDDDN
ncbi:hypothetical protein LQ327_15600 [Actinomycetospora endophytica]|uniref:Uncharacterized protein n=1 Tax=Actinomycetospora endophytica TaxID=2291215 RepID=A0ABS8P985_9PSEU|nr:hypothetical protein [Actinomycetospora endophytica]MCD2194796.1 hypothetical protein [Actinomycetospora endophytica]